MTDANMTGMDLAFTDLAKQLVEKNNSLAIILFGSRATGKNREYSDVDLGILSDFPLPLNQWLKMRDQSEKLTENWPVLVDVVDLTRASPDFLGELRGSSIFLAGEPSIWQRFCNVK